jgi:hypothetical protein
VNAASSGFPIFKSYTGLYGAQEKTGRKKKLQPAKTLTD